MNDIIFHDAIDVSSAESYCSVVDGNLYFIDKLNSNWSTFSDEDKRKALLMATRNIDRLNFIGHKHDLNQQLEFPRDYNTDIDDPIVAIIYGDDLKFACCEIATELLNGKTVKDETAKLSVMSNSYQGVKTVYEPFVPEYLKAGIISVEAWNYLFPYLVDGRSINLKRI